MKKIKIGPKTKKVLKWIWILYAIISFFIWYPKTDQLLCKDYDEVSKYVSLDDGWNVRINEEEYENVTLTEFNFAPLDKGDILVMSRTLPEDWEITEACLRFDICHSRVNMYIEDELIYEYGTERYELNKSLGSGIQFIDFPDEYKGKEIRIELLATEQGAFSALNSFRLYHSSTAVRAWLTENRIPLFVGCFLTIFGLSTLVITMFAVVFSVKYFRMFCIAAFSICMGLWTLCYNDVTLAFSIPLYSASLIEYMTLYLAPIPLFIYMHEHIVTLKYKVLKVCYWIILSVQVLATTVVMTLHTLDIVHSTAVLGYMQALMIIMLFYLILILILNFKSSDGVGKLHLIGMLIIMVCVGYDFVGYYLQRYFGYLNVPIKGMTAVGTMIYVFILIIGFYVTLTKRMMKDTERELLIKTAYTDELTNLYNRRFCAEQLNQYDAAKKSDYTIVCFDVNNLKKVNDTFGHTQGDSLIQTASGLIAEVFKQDAIVGRMGGDEFIAIVHNADAKFIDGLLAELESRIQEINAEMEDYKVSIAFGYALGTEMEDVLSEKIYQIADKRMYARKKLMKEQQAVAE